MLSGKVKPRDTRKHLDGEAVSCLNVEAGYEFSDIGVMMGIAPFLCVRVSR